MASQASSDPGFPQGFRAHVANVGIKDDSLDFLIAYSTAPCTSAAVFTQSRFAGPSVTVSRQHAGGGGARGTVVVSKNANVATGEIGYRHAVELAQRSATALNLKPAELLVGSTGVIGRQYPIEKLRTHFDRLSPDDFTASLDDAARAIMTTDTVIKTARVQVGKAVITGIAKGVGMIEPNMATLLVYLFTDAAVSSEQLQSAFTAAIEASFNSLSIDTDTSTSDTAAIFANGLAGPVDQAEFAAALKELCVDLTKQVARDGEGATKLLEVQVTGARDHAQAKRVAKAIVNSPLVKTAVHGADPNWGRVAMAIGKVSDDHDIDQTAVTISFQGTEVYPKTLTDRDLQQLEAALRQPEVTITADLGIAAGSATVWGCDLSREYIAINADYTT